MDGRILYYNPQTGQGKLILKSQEKMDFSADLWEDFDVMPAAGKLVSCSITKGELKSITPVSFEDEVDGVELKKVFHATLDIDDTFEDPSIDDEEQPKAPLSQQKPTFSVCETIEHYFKPIETFIGRPPEVVKTTSQLDFFLIERFLMTAYNDLKALDSAMHNNTEIKKLIEDIRQLKKAYNTLSARLESPKLAFEMIFLRSQPEYLQFIRYNEHCLSRISVLSKMEESLFPDIQAKEEELKKNTKKKYDESNAVEK